MKSEHRIELEALFPNQLKFDTENLKNYGSDWTTYFDPSPSCIFFPKDTNDVKKIVDWARAKKVALVPSGGRTGLSGGAVAKNQEIVVSFERMNRILDFDPMDRTVTCEAGCITEVIQTFARDKGLFYPVDFAARGSSQIGGNIATNAGGIKVVRYGLTREWVSGLEVVTGRGEVLQLNQGLIKNATGYDLKQLFIGSEGTLGFITKATLKLTRPPKSPTVMVLGLESLDSIMQVFASFQKRIDLMAFEFFSNKALEYVVRAHGLAKPFASSTAFYVVLEYDRDESEEDPVHVRALEAFESGLESGLITDGVVSQSPVQAQQLWRLREDISESLSPFKPYKNDISVRISRVTPFMDEVDTFLKSQYPDFEVIWFGHIGDGNLHINILRPEKMPRDEFVKKCQTVDAELFKIIHKYQGSISAEHGVGLTKKPFLRFTRADNEIALMRSIKQAFDPDGILNPGKIFD